MALGDQKEHHPRATTWTKEDQRRADARDRRIERQQLKHAAELAKMPPEKRQAILAQEQAVKDAEQARIKAQQLAWEEQHKAQLDQQQSAMRSIAGYLSTEVAAAVRRQERHELYEGDWLEDPVDAFTTGKAFGEEYDKPYGIKMMVNLAIDCSNSMGHNELDAVAQTALRQMYIMLRQVAQDLPDQTLRINVWQWARSQTGKMARHFIDEGESFESAIERLGQIYFDGEATWIAPLFNKIDEWENNNDAQSYHRLDIIITDGVLDHPMDVREASEIQLRRNGSLQSVVLNFLPMEEWGNFPVPKRCVQYEANPNNLLPIMRQVFGDWVTRI